jgi:hypothetical protein
MSRLFKPTRASEAQPPASDFPRDVRWIAAAPLVGRSPAAREIPPDDFFLGADTWVGPYGMW